MPARKAAQCQGVIWIAASIASSLSAAGESQVLDRGGRGETRAASSSAISPSPPSDGGEGWGEEVRFYWFPLSSVLSPLVPRGERMESLISPSPPSDGGEGWGEEVRFYWFPLSSVLSPLVPRGERMESLMQPWGQTGLTGEFLRACLETTRGAAARDFGCGQGGEFRASPQRAVRNESTPATDKRPAARRVFAEKTVWLRCSSVEDPPGIFSFVAPAIRPFPRKQRPS